MPTIPRSVIAGVIAGVLWVLCGGLVALIVWFQLLDPELYALALPQTIPLQLWHSPPALTVAVVAGSAVLVAALTALCAELLVIRRAGTPRATLFLALWFTVVAIGAVAGMLDGVAQLVGNWPPPRAAFLVRGLPESIAPTLYAGLILGWIPALAAMGGRSIDASRARRGWLVVLAAAAAILLVVSSAAAIGAARTAGLQGEPPPAVQQPRPAPTPSGTPPAGEVPAAGAVDPSWCTEQELTLTPGDGDAATGHRAGVLRATNTGSRPCVLDGYPDLAFADRYGHEVPAVVVRGGSFMTTDPGPATVTLPPGGTATALLGWDATDGRSMISALWAAPYAGARRSVLTVGYDITAATRVAVTAWEPDAGNLQE